MKKALTIALVLLIVFSIALTGCKKEEPAADMAEEQAVKLDDSITIHWAQWAPADYLQ